MSESPIHNQFIELGYDPDYLENDECSSWMCFKSKNSQMTIKIKCCNIGQTDIIYRPYSVWVVGPKGWGTYDHYDNIESVITLLFDDHGILPGMPTKGVHDESSQPR